MTCGHCPSTEKGRRWEDVFLTRVRPATSAMGNFHLIASGSRTRRMNRVRADYQSHESASFEIYVQLFPGPGPKYQVSQRGGSQVRWNRNGKELFYVAPDARLMSVPMKLDASEKNFGAGAPMPLFLTGMRGGEV